MSTILLWHPQQNYVLVDTDGGPQQIIQVVLSGEQVCGEGVVGWRGRSGHGGGSWFGFGIQGLGSAWANAVTFSLLIPLYSETGHR